jgi:hypothetical protein
MARIRTIKPEFWKHEGLCSLPEATHMLAAQLLNYADDEGYFNANPGLIKGECSPIREPSVSIPESLGRLHEAGYIRLGTSADGRRYGRIVEFDKHQRVAHPTASKISVLSITWDDIGSPPENFVNPPETFRPEQGTGNREQGTWKGAIAPPATPDPEISKSRGPRSSRFCPDAFEPDRVHALKEIPDLDVDVELAKFRDWEFKTPKQDWGRTWRRWVREAKRRGDYARAKGVKAPVKLEDVQWQ